MTRINLVPPRELTGKHLVAEYRELPRIYTLAASHYLRFGAGTSFSTLPKTYRLGKGHMKFFINKLAFLKKRQESIIYEMLNRGYEPRFDGSYPECVAALPPEFFGDYTPTEEALALSRARILERLTGSSKRNGEV